MSLSKKPFKKSIVVHAILRVYIGTFWEHLYWYIYLGKETFLFRDPKLGIFDAHGISFPSVFFYAQRIGGAKTALIREAHKYFSESSSFFLEGSTDIKRPPNSRTAQRRGLVCTDISKIRERKDRHVQFHCVARNFSLFQRLDK